MPTRPPAIAPQKCWQSECALTRERLSHYLLCLLHDEGQVGAVAERLGVDLVDVLRPAGAGGEPAGLGDHLEAANGGPVAGGLGELGDDFLAGKLRGGDSVRGELLERGFLLGRRGGVDPGVMRGAERSREVEKVFTGLLAGARGDLGGEEAEDQAVLVGGPYCAVVPQEARPGTFFASEAEGTVEKP